MSFRNRKAFATAASALLIAACMMFVIPESSSASLADAETVVIESDMNDDMPIEEIVIRYGAISAEKEHQESMGKDVIIRDNDPQRKDPKEQRFIDDIRTMIGKDRFIAEDDPAEHSPNGAYGIGQKHDDRRDTPGRGQPVQEHIDEDTHGKVSDDTSAQVITVTDDDEIDQESTDPAVGLSEEVSDDTSAQVITVTEDDEIDQEFIDSAVELAEKNDIDIMNLHCSSTFSSKLTMSMMYNEIQSIDTQSKDTDEEQDAIAVIEDDDDDPEPIVIAIPFSLHDQSYTAAAGTCVTDTLSSGTDI